MPHVKASLTDSIASFSFLSSSSATLPPSLLVLLPERGGNLRGQGHGLQLVASHATRLQLSLMKDLITVSRCRLSARNPHKHCPDFSNFLAYAFQLL